MIYRDNYLKQKCKSLLRAIEEADQYETRRDLQMEVIRMRMQIGEWLSQEPHFKIE